VSTTCILDAAASQAARGAPAVRTVIAEELFARLPDRFLMIRVLGRRGRRTLAKFTARYREWPQTLTLQSVDGQNDIYIFSVPPGSRLRSTKFGPGLMADYCVKLVNPNIWGRA